MDEEPKRPSKVRTLYLPVGAATIFSVVLYLLVPEIGAMAAASAWIGTVLFMSIWGAIYS